MISLKPKLTEKALNLAKQKGVYTFIGNVKYTKQQVKTYFESVLGYKVRKIRVVKLPQKERGKYSILRSYVKPAKKKFYVWFEGKVSIPGFDKVSKK